MGHQIIIINGTSNDNLGHQIVILNNGTIGFRKYELVDFRLRTFKSAVEKFVVDDFMISGSQEDLEQLLIDLGHPEFKHEVVRRLLKVSMGLTDV